MRYFTSAKSWIEDVVFESDTPMIAPITVPEHVARNTGLLDSQGEEIWRETRPIGFGRDEEW